MKAFWLTMMVPCTKRASTSRFHSPSLVPQRARSALTAPAIKQCSIRTNYSKGKTVTYQKSSQLYVVSDNLAFRQTGVYQRQEVSQLRKDRSVRKSVLRWLIRTWIRLFNCTFRESSVTQRRWPQRHFVAVETSQCDCVSMSVSIFDKKKKKKKKTICGLNRFLSLPNLRERPVWAAWQTICASVVSFVFSAFSIFFLNQSASSSLRPSPPFSVPACWFNQDKQLGTRSVELVSKPRLIYWLSGPPLHLTG